MRRLLFFLCLIVLGVARLSGAASAQQPTPAFVTKAKQVYMVEAKTGTVLLASNENQAFPPASLAKLMTMEVVFSAIRRGEISRDTVYPVSEYAWRTGGAPSGTTTMFAALKSQVRVEDLVKGVIVQNANDACIVLAEGISRSEGEFAARMTARAKDLGLSRSLFGNSTGLPGAENRTTARDLVELARHIHREYPEFYPLYAQPDFEWNKIFQRNKNPLLALNIGVDGLGAGFAEGSGYALVASVARNGTRLFLAMGGLASDKERLEEARKVLEWGLSSFETKVLFKQGEVVGQASVYGGTSRYVDLVAREPVDIYLPTNNPDRLSGRIVYRWPLRAPVAEGQPVGVLKISSADRVVREVPLVTAQSIKTGSLTSQATDALLELMFFWL
ncbi:D-alanyl-D-alanine carboxypeptidase family protein [Neorhizobium petrolearium]|uniref:serine-type D-Ala-D-Ala carboxypeptidase n=1 Tax=Neorhizobium petrolearium TaxID=515361 RepID=A0ABY8MBQ6_9HYPH|nr:D-alanyl-D-alanine carboxypeptidase family protein [Neorhizobium petrolearium]MCC2610157.1 D-alanyl-D-alanine carboxypeptidase [Neorhizobium petrolearium]WGI71149.1 D-alanyl-D-alanine carboxypeptidase [Neorhizobium petrolearium]